MDINKGFDTFKPGGMFKQEPPAPQQSLFNDPPKTFALSDNEKYSFRPINYYKLDIGELVRK